MLDTPDEDTPEAPATPTTQSDTPVKKTKKKAKPKKAEVKKEPKVDDGMDEIDRALAELATKNGGGGAENDTVAQATQRIDPKWAAVKEVYAFDTKYLDSDAELRRMFGSKVVRRSPRFSRSLTNVTLSDRRLEALRLLLDHNFTLDSPTTLITPPLSAALPHTSLLRNQDGLQRLVPSA